MDVYTPMESRYQTMNYRRCGKSGLLLPALSLGLWHNFGDIVPLFTKQELLRTAFDHGITHFDLANNYGPPYGEAERSLGILMERDWRPHRDEIVLSTKAGYDMWPGPYGDHGSRKYLMASLDQSLKRMRVDYVDIFYHHRPDPETPLEETLGALSDIVRQGKALYVGISNYPADLAQKAAKILRHMGTPLLICQPKYNLFERGIEDELLHTLKEQGVGCIAFAPLANGLLTNRYLKGIPTDSRAITDPRYFNVNDITDEKLMKIRTLETIAQARGQSLAQMAVAWVLRDEAVTSALIGASRPEQIEENVRAISNIRFSMDELACIDQALI